MLAFGVFVFFLATDATYPEFPCDYREVSTGTPRILAEIFKAEHLMLIQRKLNGAWNGASKCRNTEVLEISLQAARARQLKPKLKGNEVIKAKQKIQLISLNERYWIKAEF